MDKKLWEVCGAYPDTGQYKTVYVVASTKEEAQQLAGFGVAYEEQDGQKIARYFANVGDDVRIRKGSSRSISTCAKIVKITKTQIHVELLNKIMRFRKGDGRELGTNSDDWYYAEIKMLTPEFIEQERTYEENKRANMHRRALLDTINEHDFSLRSTETLEKIAALIGVGK